MHCFDFCIASIWNRWDGWFVLPRTGL